MTIRRALGDVAEQMAADHLMDAGYEILERNWTCRQGEIDLIARLDKTLVFVEVRSSSTAFLVGADVTVTAGKQRRVCTAADLWLDRNAPSQLDVRFDVIAVEHGQSELDGLEHYEDAFTAPWAI
ncbi:MAG: YraN family protein [Myxococcales bacterium]|nr:YraN family protein [Myxococcales bacterium]|tara:strand:+ start:385 stop:759 length:375 start_codon:yes stop_codon:yes gene_type:complete